MKRMLAIVTLMSVFLSLSACSDSNRSESSPGNGSNPIGGNLTDVVDTAEPAKTDVDTPECKRLARIDTKKGLKKAIVSLQTQVSTQWVEWDKQVESCWYLAGVSSSTREPIEYFRSHIQSDIQCEANRWTEPKYQEIIKLMGTILGIQEDSELLARVHCQETLHPETLEARRDYTESAGNWKNQVQSYESLISEMNLLSEQLLQ